MTNSLCTSPKYQILDILVVFAGALAVFFLLTNGIPLVQTGWIGELGKKSRYVRLMSVAVAAFAALMVFVRVKWPQSFESLSVVKIWHLACRVPLGALCLCFFFTYAAIMSAVGFQRHLALETRAFDLGIFAQAVWNTLQGHFLFSSIKENINLLGDHVSPILLLAAPFYKIWPDPRMLVLLQAVAAASSFFPLALIVRDRLKDRPIVIIFLLMFFFYQPMRAALHEDFHPEVLAEPFLWWAFLFLDRGKIIRFLLCLLAAVAGKENFLGIAFMFGIYAFFYKRIRILGMGIMLSAAGLFALETMWLVPHLSGAKYFYGANYASLFSESSPGIIQRLFSPESLEYAFKVFLPFLFLPIFHLSTLLLALPVFFQNLLSSNGAMRSFNYHYFTGLTPFLFIATIFALVKLRDKSKWFSKQLIPISFLLLTISLLRSGPSEYWFLWNIRSHRTSHTEMVRSKLAEIPADARVLTHNSFIPQLCNRQYIYQFNYNPKPTKLEFAEKYNADTVIWDKKFWEPNTDLPESTLPLFIAAGYRIVFEKDGFFILTNGARRPHGRGTSLLR